MLRVDAAPVGQDLYIIAILYQINPDLSIRALKARPSAPALKRAGAREPKTFASQLVGRFDSLLQASYRLIAGSQRLQVKAFLDQLEDGSRVIIVGMVDRRMREFVRDQ